MSESWAFRKPLRHQRAAGDGSRDAASQIIKMTRRIHNKPAIVCRPRPAETAERTQSVDTGRHPGSVSWLVGADRPQHRTNPCEVGGCIRQAHRVHYFDACAHAALIIDFGLANHRECEHGADGAIRDRSRSPMRRHSIQKSWSGSFRSRASNSPTGICSFCSSRIRGRGSARRVPCVGST